MNKHIIGDLLGYIIGGGWGSEAPDGDQNTPNYVIRSADFPSIEKGSFAGVPLRFDALNFVNKRSLQDGDILLEISGGTKNRPTGRTVYISEKLLRSAEYAVIPASFCRLLRFKKEVVFPKYMYYLLQSWWTSGGSWEFQNQSTGIANFQFKIFAEKFEVSLPSLKEQERIAGILGSLDDKIEANTRLIQTVKDYMAAFYKAEAKNGKVLELTDIANFVNGRAFTKDATGTGRVVIRIAELNNGLGGSTVYNDIEAKKENTAYPGDVLMSWSGSLDTYVWHLPEAIINQHIFKVIPKGNYPKWLVYHACKSVIEDFQAIAVDKATTMGHIRRGDLKRDISIPAREMPQMENLWSLWMNLEQENLQLAETRDVLIKRLIG